MAVEEEGEGEKWSITTSIAIAVRLIAIEIKNSIISNNPPPQNLPGVHPPISRPVGQHHLLRSIFQSLSPHPPLQR